VARLSFYVRTVHTFQLFLLLTLRLALSATAQDRPVIQDPIADYLAMNVPDRATNARPLFVLKKVEVDIAGDGNPVVFIGTWYRNSGPNTWLWAGYQHSGTGFHRITPDHSDVLIDFEGIYVGPLTDLQCEGMAQAYSLELDNKDRGQSNLISDVTFYYLKDGKLVEQESGTLDREDPNDLAKYEFYFGPGRKTRETPRVEAFTIPDLTRRGYKIPTVGAKP
jgi:hypothetical protein